MLDVKTLMNIQVKIKNNKPLKMTCKELSNTLLITKIQQMVTKIYASYSQWQTRLVEDTSKLPAVIELSIPVGFDCFLRQTKEQKE